MKASCLYLLTVSVWPLLLLVMLNLPSRFCMSWRVFRGAYLCWQRVFRVHRFRVAMHRRVVLRIESTRHLHDAAITLQHNIKRVRPTPYMLL